MTLRRATTADLDALVALEAACFDEPARWSAPSWQAELDGDNRAVWVVEATRRAEDDGCQAFGELVSAGCFRLNGNEAELFRVMTAPETRGLGLATMVLTAGLAWAHQAGADTMHLEVRRDNTTARSLYADLGFTDAYVRTNYYAFGQDAVVMSRPLTDAPRDSAAVRASSPKTAAAHPSGRGLWAELHDVGEDE